MINLIGDAVTCMFKNSGGEGVGNMISITGSLLMQLVLFTRASDSTRGNERVMFPRDRCVELLYKCSRSVGEGGGYLG